MSIQGPCASEGRSGVLSGEGGQGGSVADAVNMSAGSVYTLEAVGTPEGGSGDGGGGGGGDRGRWEE